jgi:hypothetical protein
MTWILSVCFEYLVTRNWQQMVSGDLQLAHAPVFTHGLLLLKRWLLIGAATFLALFMAVSTSGHTLFIPTIINTFFGP